jgi:hypothetical protein
MRSLGDALRAAAHDYGTNEARLAEGWRPP